MKKSLTFTVLLISATMGFAQGKLELSNDSTHLAYFAQRTGLQMLPGDEDLAKHALTTELIDSLLSSPTLIVSLWGGTHSSSLTLQTVSGSWSDTPGIWTPVNVTLFNLPAGVPAYFRIEVHDSRDYSAVGSWSGLGRYAGWSEIFTAVPQASVYAPIFQATAPVNSTWAAGPVTDLANSTGWGAIEVGVLPEPSTFTLAALGAVAVMLARRRR